MSSTCTSALSSIFNWQDNALFAYKECYIQMQVAYRITEIPVLWWRCHDEIVTYQSRCCPYILDTVFCLLASTIGWICSYFACLVDWTGAAFIFYCRHILPNYFASSTWEIWKSLMISADKHANCLIFMCEIHPFSQRAVFLFGDVITNSHWREILFFCRILN